jgi:hypothetical protein
MHTELIVVPFGCVFISLQAAVSHQQALALSPAPVTGSAVHTPAGAASSWPTALSFTALVHVSCLVGGLGLRAALQLWLTHSTEAASTAGAAAAGVQANLGVGPLQQLEQQQVLGGVLGALVVAALMVEAVRSLVASPSSSLQSEAPPTSKGDAGMKQQQGQHAEGQHAAVPGLQAAVVWQQVRVALLSAAAAVMTALACLNWALAYVTCMGLMPLAAATSPGRTSTDVCTDGLTSQEGGGGSSSSSVGAAARHVQIRVRARPLPLLLLRLAAWVVLSPGALLVAWVSCTGFPSPGPASAAAAAAAAACADVPGLSCGTIGSGAVVEQVVGLIVGSRWSAYWVACGVYMPFWLLTGLMLSRTYSTP